MPSYSIELNLKEIDLIMKLRNFEYGILEVYKIDGKLLRVIYKQNALLTDEDGMKAYQLINKSKEPKAL